MPQEEALAYSVPDSGYPGWEAGPPAMLAAAAAALPDLAVLDLTFFAPPAIAAVAALLGARHAAARRLATMLQKLTAGWVLLPGLVLQNTLCAASHIKASL